MLMFGKLGILIALIRLSVHFSHPIFYALIWGLLVASAALLSQSSLQPVLLAVALNIAAVAIYFYLLDYLEGSWWWWLAMPAGAYVLLFIL